MHTTPMVNLQESDNLLDVFYLKSSQLKKEFGRVEIYPSPSKADPSLGQILIFVNLPKKKDTEIIPHLIASEFKTNYFSAIVSNAEQAFEYALQKINIALRSQLKGTTDHLWLKEFQALLLAVCGDEAHISLAGEVYPYIATGYKIARLNENEEKVPPHYTKVFSSIISGKLTRNSSLIAVNSSVLDYFSLETLKKTSLQNENVFSGSLKELLLKSREPNLTFFALCLKLKNESRIKTESKTLEEILKPDAPVSSAKKYGQIHKFGLWALLYAAKQISRALNALISLSRELLGNKTYRNSILNGVSDNTIGRLIKASLWLNSKKTIFKLSAYSVLLILSVFFYSLSFSYYKNQNFKEINLFDETLKGLVEQKNKAETALIYNDKDTASLVLESINISLSNLESKSEEQSEKKEEFKKKIQEVFNKIHNLEEIASLSTAYNLPKNFSPKILVPKGGNLRIIDMSNGKVIDFKDGKVKIGETLKIPKDAKDIDYFNEKLYALIPKKNAIEVNGKKWNIEANGLSESKAISIDGFIYTLNSGNRIDKWLKGKKEASLSLPKEIKADSTILFTGENSKSIYSLDPAQGKIYVQDKNGKLLKQLRNETFGQAAGLYVDEKKNQGYILTTDDLKVFKLP